MIRAWGVRQTAMCEAASNAVLCRPLTGRHATIGSSGSRRPRTIQESAMGEPSPAHRHPRERPKTGWIRGRKSRLTSSAM